MPRFQFNLRTLFWLTAIATVCSLQWAGGSYEYAQGAMRAAAVGFLLAATASSMLNR